MLPAVALLLLSLVARGLAEDAVAANVGAHGMSRIAELLSSSECRQLLERLRGPQEDIEEELEKLSEERNPLRPRHPRHPQHSPRCSQALRRWLATAGQLVTWDRLARELQLLGRGDIARELGKNLIQDRMLELRKNVEEYGRSVQRKSSPLLLPEAREQQGTRSRRAPEEQELGELHLQRLPPPPYTRSLLGWLAPVLLGIFGGFLVSVLVSTVAVFSCRWMLGLDAT